MFALLLVAVAVTAVLAMIGRRYGLAKPAKALLGAGFLGAVLFVIGTSVTTETETHSLTGLIVIGPLISLICVVGLLSLAILWAYRRWSGFYEER